MLVGSGARVSSTRLTNRRRDECRRAMYVIKCRELETVVDPDTTSIKLVAR